MKKYNNLSILVPIFKSASVVEEPSAVDAFTEELKSTLCGMWKYMPLTV